VAGAQNDVVRMSQGLSPAEASLAALIHGAAPVYSALLGSGIIATLALAVLLVQTIRKVRRADVEAGRTPLRPFWSEDWLNPQRLAVYPRLFLAAYMAFGLMWWLVSPHQIDPQGKPLGYDFIIYWTASHLALSGRAAEAYDPTAFARALHSAMPSAHVGYVWLYPPNILLLIAPLALLPYLASYLAWSVAFFGLYLTSMRALFANLRAGWLLAAFPGAYVTLAQGQNGFLTLILLGVGVLNLDRRPILAGALIGLLSYKPHFGVLLPLVLAAGGYWRSFAAAAVCVVATSGLALLVYGADSWVGFLHALPQSGVVLEHDAQLWSKMPSVYAALRLVGVGAGPAFAGHAVVALTVGAFTLLAWLRRTTPLRLRAALLSVAVLLIPPYGFDYDLVVLALPIALMAQDGLERGWTPGMRTILAAAWLAPLLFPPVAALTHIQLTPLLLLGLFAAVRGRISNAPSSPGSGSAARERSPPRALAPKLQRSDAAILCGGVAKHAAGLSYAGQVCIHGAVASPGPARPMRAMVCETRLRSRATRIILAPCRPLRAS
jgi:hypothetical protein